jgi:hypothetical protein
MTELKQRLLSLLSRKFLAALLGLTLIVLDTQLGIGLTPEDKTKIIGVAMTYILAEGAADFKSRPVAK